MPNHTMAAMSRMVANSLFDDAHRKEPPELEVKLRRDWPIGGFLLCHLLVIGLLMDTSR